jgi:hypothetical protein
MKKIKNLLKKIDMDFAVKMTLGILLSLSLFFNLKQSSEGLISELQNGIITQKYGFAIKQQNNIIKEQQDIIGKYTKQNAELTLFNQVIIDLLEKMKGELNRRSRAYEI